MSPMPVVRMTEATTRLGETTLVAQPIAALDALLLALDEAERVVADAIRAAEFDPAVPVVVYCWSPGCNAGAKGAVEFAKRGFSVREMIGGYEYWAREGLPVEGEDGPLPRVFDPLVMYVRPERSERG